MDLSSIVVTESEGYTDEEIAQWMAQQEKEKKDSFFETSSNVGRRYKNKRLSDYIAETDEQKHILETVKQYIKDVNEGKDRTLWMCGATGTGKTLLGSCICYETKGVYCKTYDIKDDLVENHFQRKQTFRKWTNYHSFQLLNERYENEVSTVIITNLSPSELKEKLGQALYDRFVHNCVSLTFKGESHRKSERSINI